jgi:predicted nucleic acid-binding protein
VTATTASKLLLIDSSGWLEYLTGDSKAVDFARYIQGSIPLLMPTVVLYEVYKKLLMSEGKTSADRFASDALRRKVAPLDDDLAIAAAEVSAQRRLAMADAIIYATAQAYHAQLITGDLAFRGLPGVIIP